MSHLGTRLLADAFASETEGIDAVAEIVPLHGNDPRPSRGITIYDDTRDLWVMRKMAPKPEQGVEYPCVRLMTLNVDYTSGVPDTQSTNARTVKGTLQVAAQLLLLENDGENPATIGMYLLRAMRGAIAVFDHPKHYGERQSCGVRLEPATSVRQAQIEAPLGDNIVSPGAFLITYPFTEEVPISE